MKKKIVIIDDDPGIQDVLQMIFRRAGYETYIFAHGAPIFENKYERPDVFLIDKQLSGENGLDICRHLKQAKGTHDIPVIMISASPEISALYKDAGADDYIEKPFASKDLLCLVSKYTASVKA